MVELCNFYNKQFPTLQFAFIPIDCRPPLRTPSPVFRNWHEVHIFYSPEFCEVEQSLQRDPELLGLQNFTDQTPEVPGSQGCLELGSIRREFQTLGGPEI